MPSGTRKITSKEIQQDADQYMGTYGEVWFQEGQTSLRFGDGITPGGVTAAPKLGDIYTGNQAPQDGVWLETGRYYPKSVYPTLAAQLGDVPDIGDPTLEPQAQLPISFSPRTIRCTNTNGTRWVAVGVGGTITYSDDGEYWKFALSPTATNLNGVKYLNNMWVAYGDSGVVIYSSDAITWTSPLVGASQNLTDVTYGAGVYVVVGASRSLWYSSNLQIWNQVVNINTSTPTAYNFTSVQYANNQFVAVASQGFIYTSVDGINWSQSRPDINEIAFGNSTYVAVGNSGLLCTSSNGTSWSVQPALGTRDLLRVVYLNSLFVAIGLNGSCYTSVDGVVWISRSFTSVNLNDIAFGAGVFVVVGDSGQVWSSSDGASWTTQSLASRGNVTKVVFSNSRFVLVADRPFWSSDGITWNSTTGGTWLGSASALAFGNNQWYSLGSLGDNFSNDNGATWTASGQSTNCRFLIYAFNLWITMRSTTTISTATTAAPGTWTSRQTNAGAARFCAFGNSRLVIASTNGAWWTSTNGTAWTSIATLTTNQYNHVEYLNNLWIMSGTNSAILSSTDSVTITIRNGQTQNLNFVGYNNSTWMVVGERGSLLVNSDIRQNPQSITSLTLTYVDYVGGVYVTIGNTNNTTSPLFVSTTGSTWTDRSLSCIRNLNYVTYYENTWYVLGNTGFYAQSSDTITWTINQDITHTDLLASRVIADKFVWFGVNECFTFGNSRQVLLTTGDNDQISIVPQDRSFPQMVTFGLGYYVMACGGGVIIKSTNGIDWTSVYTNITSNLDKSYFLNNRFLILGASGTILTSTDTTTWTVITAGIRTFNAAAFGNSTWVVVGSTGSIYYSTDGTTWSAATGTGSGNFQDIVYANNLFVAVGSSGSIYTSINGISWTSRGTLSTTQTMNRVIYALDSYWIAGTNGVYQSVDGINWQASWTFSGSVCQDLIFADNKLVITVNGTNINGILYSTTGNLWSFSSFVDVTPSVIVYDGVKFWALTHPTSLNLGLFSSINLSLWTRESTPTVRTRNRLNFLSPYNHYLTATYTNNTLIVIPASTQNYNSLILTYDNGANWSMPTFSNNRFLPRNTFTTGGILYKKDSLTLYVNYWLYYKEDTDAKFSRANLNSRLPVFDVTYGNNEFLAILGAVPAFSGSESNPAQESPTVFASVDGKNWSKRSALITSFQSLFLSNIRIQYAAGRFVILLQTPQRLTSTDIPSIIYTSADQGLTWQSSGLNINSAMSIATDGSVLILADRIYVYRSTDGGVTWSRILAMPNNLLPSSTFGRPNVFYSNGVFILDRHLSRDSGLTWEEFRTDIYSVLTGNPGSPGSYITTYINGSLIYAFNRQLPNGIEYWDKNTGAKIGVELANSTQIPMASLSYSLYTQPVDNGDTLYVPLESPTVNASPWWLEERPLCSYNTQTTFWIPPVPTVSGKTYMYAGTGS